MKREKLRQASVSGAPDSREMRVGASRRLRLEPEWSVLTCLHARCRTRMAKVPGNVRITRALDGHERTELGFVPCPNQHCRQKWEVDAA